MHRPHFADDLPQLVAGFAHAVRRYFVERAALVPDRELSACGVLSAGARESECSAASLAPEQLNGLHRHLFRPPRADELPLCTWNFYVECNWAPEAM